MLLGTVMGRNVELCTSFRYIEIAVTLPEPLTSQSTDVRGLPAWRRLAVGSMAMPRQLATEAGADRERTGTMGLSGAVTVIAWDSEYS